MQLQPDFSYSWMEEAACLGCGPQIFFPVDDETGRSAAHASECEEAFAICKQCPVEEDCLNYALENPTFCRWGIWGGKSANQRRTILRLRRFHARGGLATAMEDS